MKIGFLTYSNVDTGAGIEYWLKEVCPRLSKRHKVQIMTSDHGTRTAPIRDALAQYGIRTHEFRLLFGASSIPNSTGVKAIRGFFDEHDVIYFFYCPGGLEILSSLFQTTVHKRVLAAHTYPPSRYRNTGNVIPVRQLYSTLLGDGGLRVGKYLWAHNVENEDLKTELKRWKIKRIYKIIAGVDTNSFKPSEKRSRFTVLFLGRLEATKGADLLPQLYTMLANRIENFDFMVAGEGTLYATLKRHETKNFKFLGFVDDQNKRRLLSSSHVLVAPSRVEALMHVGIEAMASGTPLISSDVSGVREYLVNGRNGYLVRSLYEMAKMTELVYQFWLSGSGYDNLSRQARESVEAFSYDRATPKIERLLIDTAEANE